MRRNWREIFADAKARGLCAADIAREQGVSGVAVLKQRKRCGVDLASGRPGFTARRDWAAIIATAQAEDLTAAETARRFAVSQASIHHQCRYARITLRDGRKGRAA